jgi:hypothetical protein
MERVPGPVFPTASLALAVKECVPSASAALTAQLQEPFSAATAVQADAGSPSMYTLTVEPGSAVPLRLGTLAATAWPECGPTSVGTAGASASTLKERQADGRETLAAPSVVVAIMVWGPEANGWEGVQLQAPLSRAVAVQSSVESSYTET